MTDIINARDPEPAWVTCTAGAGPMSKRLHDLGDSIHRQKTPRDWRPKKPDRYCWATLPADSSVLLCLDDPRQVCLAWTVTDDTQWVAAFIRDVIKVGRQKMI